MGSKAFLLLVLAGCAQSERLYYLSDVGLHSVLTSGDKEIVHAEWDADTDSCRTESRGLGVDEIEQWATVTCGTTDFSRMFKVDFSRLDGNKWVEIVFDLVDKPLFYGTAINTATHTAYVASFETSGSVLGWVVRGQYLRGCDTITSQPSCLEKGPCFWYDGKCAIKRTYTLMKLPAHEPIGGGLYADEQNNMWLSYETDEGGEGGGYVKSKDPTTGDIVNYPHVHDTFPAANYGKQEIGYPCIVGGYLYAQSLQTGKGVELYRFDSSHDPELVHASMRTFRGWNINPDGKIRQPSFAMITETRLLHVESNSIVEQECDTFPCTSSTKSIASHSNMGPIFYRKLPVKTDAPDTQAPTPVPETYPPTDKPFSVILRTSVPRTFAPLPPGETHAPLPPGETRAPAAPLEDTLVPGTTSSPVKPPPGETLAPGSTPGATTAPGLGGATTPQDDSSDGSDDMLLMWILLAVTAALCLLMGIVGGLYCHKKNKAALAAANAYIPPTTNEERILESTHTAPSSPEIMPKELASFEGFVGAPIGGERNFSSNTDSSLIQAMDLTVVNCRLPAGDVRDAREGSGRGRPGTPTYHNNRRRSVAMGSRSMNSGNYSSLSLHNTLSALPSDSPGSPTAHSPHYSGPAFAPIGLSPTTSYQSHHYPGTPTSHSLQRPRERLRSVADRATVKGVCLDH